jgi:hypothetical protein
MGAYRGENKGTTIENMVRISNCKVIYHDKAPMMRNPLHGVES